MHPNIHLLDNPTNGTRPYLPSQGSSGVVITEEVLGVMSTYISTMYLHEKEQRLQGKEEGA